MREGKQCGDVELSADRNGSWLGYGSGWESLVDLQEDKTWNLGEPALGGMGKEGGNIPQGGEFRGSALFPRASLEFRDVVQRPARARAGTGGRPSRLRPAAITEPPDSPSSLPAGCAPDTASNRRRALSWSKRTPSGSRPSCSSELLHGPAPPGSAASAALGVGHSIFPASLAVEELRMRPRSRAVGGRGFGPASKSREVRALQAPLGRSPEAHFVLVPLERCWGSVCGKHGGR